MSDVTGILNAITNGDPEAAHELLPLVYAELRKLAATKIAQEKPGQTLQATALVHEAYLRLVDVGRVQRWDSRGHFFSAAAEAMRRILIDQARRKRAAKAGGDARRIDMAEVEPWIEPPEIDLLALDEALTRLESRNVRQAEVVKVRFFGGLTIDETAQVLGVSASTVENDWTYAKAWLRIEMGDRGSPAPV